MRGLCVRRSRRQDTLGGMHRLLRTLLVALLAATALTVAGCSSAPAADPSAYAAVIDVRTPAEFAESHVDGAVNIDVQDPSFDQKVAELDAAGTYLVYCRSGNRSAQAAARMKQAGLEVVDGGGLTDMQSAGWSFVP